MAKSKKTSNNKNKTKKNTHSNIEVGNTPFSNETSKIIKCILIVVVIFACMYGVTVLILKNSPYEYTKDDVQTSIQYEEILAGTSFQKKDSEYFVLFYHAESDSKYMDMISDYQAKESHLPIYYVNLDNKMNSSVISEESNREAKDASELKIKDVALIRFKDGRIDEYIDDSSKISETLS